MAVKSVMDGLGGCLLEKHEPSSEKAETERYEKTGGDVRSAMGNAAEPVRFFRELLKAPRSEDPNGNHGDRQA